MQQRAHYSQSLSDRRFEIPGPKQINPNQIGQIRNQMNINQAHISSHNNNTKSVPTTFCPNCPCHHCLVIKNQMQHQQNQSPRQYQEPITEYSSQIMGGNNRVRGGSNMSDIEFRQQQTKNDYMLGYQTDYRNGNGAMTPIDFSSGKMSRDKYSEDYLKRDSFNTNHFTETVNLMGHNNHVRYDRPEMNTKHKLKTNTDMRMSGAKTMGAPADILN